MHVTWPDFGRGLGSDPDTVLIAITGVMECSTDVDMCYGFRV